MTLQFFLENWFWLILMPIAFFYSGFYYHKLVLFNETEQEKLEASLRLTNKIDIVLDTLLVPTGAKVAGLLCVKNEEHLLYGEKLFKYIRTNEMSIDESVFPLAKLYEEINALSREMRGLTALMHEHPHITITPLNQYENMPYWKERLEKRGFKSAVFIRLKQKIAGDETLFAILYLKFTEETPLDSEYIRHFEYTKIEEIKRLMVERTKTIFPILANYS